MTVHLRLIRHASTAGMRTASFPADEPLNSQGRRGLARVRAHLGRADRRFTSPALQAVQTAEALGLEASIEPAIRDLDCGRWRGQAIRDVEEREPEALAEWLRDPATAPHGGESILALIERTRTWLDGQMNLRGATLAITHGSVIRAAVIVAIDAEPRSFWRIDVAPLSLVRLSGDQGRWRLISLGVLPEEAK